MPRAESCSSTSTSSVLVPEGGESSCIISRPWHARSTQRQGVVAIQY
jgi:hypothetical protein